MKKPAGKKSKTKTKSPRTKHYPVHLLALVLVAFIGIESFLAFNTTAADWKAGFSILDVSDGIKSMASDATFAAQPILAAANTVNDFYAQAATAAGELLAPNSYTDPMIFVSGVNEFYRTAADQAISLLDISDYTRFGSWQSPDMPSIASATITR